MEETREKEQVSLKVLQDAFKFLEITITEPEFEYLIMNLFASTFDLDSLPYKKLFSLVSKTPSSALLKSPSRRLNSLRPRDTSFASKNFSRVSLAANISMTKQIEELAKNEKFWEKNHLDNESEFFF